MTPSTGVAHCPIQPHSVRPTRGLRSRFATSNLRLSHDGEGAHPLTAAAVPVFVIRGEQVVLDADVASGFGVETKRVNEAVARNPEKFNDSHVFRLSNAEFEDLRSQSATSSAEHGGRRYPPYAFTAKGVARLATILSSNQALLATDLIIDTFLQVQRQIVAGRHDIAIAQPSRLRPGDAHGLGDQVRAKLAQAVSALLDTVIDVRGNRSVRESALDLGSDALDHLRQRLRAKGLENAKLEADAMLVMAQAEKVYAETRKGHAEAEGIELDNIPKRITAVKELMALYRESEPAQLVQLLTDMNQAPALEIKPGPPRLRTSENEI